MEDITKQNKGQCKVGSGYCRDNELIAVAKAATLDYRQNRERKIAVARAYDEHEISVTDRYVLTCCKWLKEKLTQYRLKK